MNNSTLLAAVVSQILIIIAWEDGEFGTILNIIIEHVCFGKMVDRESSEIFSNTTRNTTKIISEKDLNHLPDIIKNRRSN